MRKLCIIFGALVLLGLVSCQNEEEIKILNSKIEADTLHGSIQFPVITELAADIMLFDSLLVIITPINKDGICFVFSTFNGHVKYTFGKRGRGPGEFLQPYTNQFGHNILLWDVNNIFSEVLFGKNTNNEITFDLLRSLEIKKGGCQIYRLNSELLISNIHKEGMFALFNNKGEPVGDYFGNSPLRDYVKEYYRFQGVTAISDTGNIFVYGTFDLGYICAYEINKKNQPILKWEFYLNQKPFYKITNGDVKWDKNKQVQGIKDIQINSDKIFVLYSGRSISLPRNKPEGTFSDNLFLLNMDGEIVKKYKLDIPVFKFCFSEMDSAIYGITMTDDWQIVKFDFPGLNNL